MNEESTPERQWNGYNRQFVELNQMKNNPLTPKPSVPGRRSPLFATPGRVGHPLAVATHFCTPRRPFNVFNLAIGMERDSRVNKLRRASDFRSGLDSNLANSVELGQLGQIVMMTKNIENKSEKSNLANFANLAKYGTSFRKLISKDVRVCVRRGWNDVVRKNREKSCSEVRAKISAGSTRGSWQQSRGR